MTVSYNPDRDISDKWKNTVGNWISKNGEVLVIIRYLHAAGQKDWILVQSYDRLMDIIEILPVGSDVIANKYFNIKYRGKVTGNILNAAETWFDNQTEYLIVGLNRKTCDSYSISGTDGIGIRSLIEDLNEFINEDIVIGVCPNYSTGDHEDMVSFSKGGIDGAR